MKKNFATLPHWSLSDPATWVTLLSVFGALVAVVHPGFHIQPFIPAASVVAAGVVTAAVAFAKHQVNIIGAIEDIVKVVEEALNRPTPPPTSRNKLVK